MNNDSTPEALREIDKRVAVEMGYTVTQGKFGHWEMYDPNGGPVDRYMVESDTWLKCSPHFTTDPAAADLVRLEIERRGWGIGLDSFGDEGGRFNRWAIFRKSQTIGEASGAYYEALCLAFLSACSSIEFLAACDAAKEQEEENDE